MMTEKDNRESGTAQEALAKLVEDMERVRGEFSMTCDADLMEACSYELKALEARCRYLLRLTREMERQSVQASQKTDALSQQPHRRMGLIRICGTGR